MFKFYRKLIKDGRTWELQKKAIFSRRSLLLFLSKFLKLEERMHDIGTEVPDWRDVSLPGLNLWMPRLGVPRDYISWHLLSHEVMNRSRKRMEICEKWHSLLQQHQSMWNAIQPHASYQKEKNNAII